MTFDAKRAMELAEQCEEDDKRMTQGEWAPRYEPHGTHGGGDDWHIDGGGQCVSCGLSDNTAQSQADATAICRTRNSIADVAKQLRAAVELVERQARRITILVMDQRRQLPEDVLRDIADAHTERDSLLAEREQLRGEVQNLRKVYEAAKTWCETVYVGKLHPRFPAYPNDELLHAVNTVKFASAIASLPLRHRREREVVSEPTRPQDCEHERLSADKLTCLDCEMEFIACRACSEAGGAGLAVWHGKPECRTTRTKP